MRTNTCIRSMYARVCTLHQLYGYNLRRVCRCMCVPGYGPHTYAMCCQDSRCRAVTVGCSIADSLDRRYERTSRRSTRETLTVYPATRPQRSRHPGSHPNLSPATHLPIRLRAADRDEHRPATMHKCQIQSTKAGKSIARGPSRFRMRISKTLFRVPASYGVGPAAGPRCTGDRCQQQLGGARTLRCADRHGARGRTSLTRVRAPVEVRYVRVVQQRAVQRLMLLNVYT